MGDLSFQHLNTDWNSEPNAPHVELTVEGKVLRLSFVLNPWAYNAKQGDAKGHWSFRTATAGDGMPLNVMRGFQGRAFIAEKAPEWGEFYEVTGKAWMLMKATGKSFRPMTRMPATSYFTSGMRRLKSSHVTGHLRGARRVRSLGWL